MATKEIANTRNVLILVGTTLVLFVVLALIGRDVGASPGLFL